MELPRETIGALLLGGVLLSVGWRGRPESAPPAPSDASGGGSGFAVVELFTSEGCSSCPPADALLAQIEDDARRSGERIIPLSFHVDYWNNLGWRDPFSSSAFSERQRMYARTFGSGRVYTPQMIVNGTAEFVGSDRAAARAAIGAALARPAVATIALRQVSPREVGAVAVSFEATGAAPGAALFLALLERSAESRVGRGENGGRTLRHANVVRALDSVGLAPGRAEWRIPSGLAPRDLAVAAFVREAGGATISGGARIDLI